MNPISTIGRLRFWRASLCPAALAAWILSGASVAPGQQLPESNNSPAKGKKTDATVRQASSDPNVAMRVFRLKYADADGIQRVLTPFLAQLGGEDSVVADLRTNSIVVLANPETTKLVEGIVRILDVDGREGTERNPLTTKIFTPNNLVLDGTIDQEIRMMVSERGRFAVDPARNAVVVQDTVEALSAVEALVTKLEEASENSVPKVLQVRVVWLISGMDRRDVVATPADLKKVADDLAKIGVEGLKLAAQTTIRAVPDVPFEMKSSPQLDNPCELTLSGTFVQRQGRPMSLKIRLSATETLPSEPGPTKSRRLCGIDTTVIAPLGHTVVLGAAPVGKMTSVFVVQLTSAE
jgi:hypothetical protein